MTTSDHRFCERNRDNIVPWIDLIQRQVRRSPIVPIVPIADQGRSWLGVCQCALETGEDQDQN